MANLAETLVDKELKELREDLIQFTKWAMEDSPVVDVRVVLMEMLKVMTKGDEAPTDTSPRDGILSRISERMSQEVDLDLLTAIFETDELEPYQDIIGKWGKTIVNTFVKKENIPVTRVHMLDQRILKFMVSFLEKNHKILRETKKKTPVVKMVKEFEVKEEPKTEKPKTETKETKTEKTVSIKFDMSIGDETFQTILTLPETMWKFYQEHMNGLPADNIVFGKAVETVVVSDLMKNSTIQKTLYREIYDAMESHADNVDDPDVYIESIIQYFRLGYGK